MAANDWFCQFLADMLDARVERPAQLETTALGAAFLAGLATGVWPDLQAVAGTWANGAPFSRGMAAARRAEMVAGWKTALRRTLCPLNRDRISAPGRAQRLVAERQRHEEDRQHAAGDHGENTPPQPQWSAIQPTPVPAIADPNT